MRRRWRGGEERCGAVAGGREREREREREAR
jgi:hypothetical protein